VTESDCQDTSVLSPTAVPTLTLVTCFPFYFVRHAPKRYIVTGNSRWPIHAVLLLVDVLFPRLATPRNKEEEK
jgi:hypothetical protein